MILWLCDAKRQPIRVYAQMVEDAFGALTEVGAGGSRVASKLARVAGGDWSSKSQSQA
jgi:hypothetical protein